MKFREQFGSFLIYPNIVLLCFEYWLRDWWISMLLTTYSSVIGFCFSNQCSYVVYFYLILGSIAPAAFWIAPKIGCNSENPSFFCLFFENHPFEGHFNYLDGYTYFLKFFHPISGIFNQKVKKNITTFCIFLPNFG